MPKSYEEEIRDLLQGMERFPGENRRRPKSRWSLSRLSLPRLSLPRHLDAHRIMGGALILILVSWVLRWGGGSRFMIELAGYISLLSTVLFVVAIVMLIRGGRFGSRMATEQRWRGQVINMQRRGGPVASVRRWWTRTTARFSRGRSGRMGRDSIRW